MARTPKSTTPRKRENAEKVFYSSTFKPFSAKTEQQKKYFNALSAFTIIFGTGPAGTGKTACAVSYALQELFYGRIDKVVLVRSTRPACDEQIGFLPGSVDEKIFEFLVPIKEIGEEVLGKGMYEMFVKSGKIIGVPLAFCRGRTFNDAHLILDEAQNTKPEQMKMLLTRIGRNSKVFVNGDSDQSDIKELNGLEDAVKRLSWHPEVKVVEFEQSDIVRNGIISEILDSYKS